MRKEKYPKNSMNINLSKFFCYWLAYQLSILMVNYLHKPHKPQMEKMMYWNGITDSLNQTCSKTVTVDDKSNRKYTNIKNSWDPQ